MKHNKLQTLGVVLGSVVAGALAGWGSRPQLLPPLSPEAQNARAVASPSGSRTALKEGTTPSGPLASQSEVDSFGGFDFQRQLDVLKKLGTKYGQDFPASAQLLMARAVLQLSSDQAAALLEGLDKDGSKTVRVELARRLAEADPERALALGKNLEDPMLLAKAAGVVAMKSGAEALRVIGGLPPQLMKAAFQGLSDGIDTGEVHLGGTASELVSALKENPTLMPLSESSKIPRLFGGFLAEMAVSDPANALAQARAITTELAGLSGDADPKAGGRNAQMLLEGVLDRLRAYSPSVGSRFFDAIPDAEKSPWMLPMEALQRFKSEGVDAAIALAERQQSEEFGRKAASGVWWGLAQQDRAAAFSWIESLPQGAFRQGVLSSVMMDAWMQSMSWGSDKAAIAAGEGLLSKASQLDYYAAMLSERRFGGRQASVFELISSLPVSNAEKAELFRRVAPIKQP